MPRKAGSLVTFKCRICGTTERVRGGNSMFRCAQCKAEGLTPGYRRHRFTGKEEAGAAVGLAIRDGRLVHPTALRCADCAGPATEYEHRDYNAPLDVEPVCRSCNLRRGPAVPVVGAFESILTRGCMPYRLRRSVEKLLVTMGRPTAVLRDMPARLDREHWLRLMPLIGAEGAPDVPSQEPTTA